jgi:cysteine desulfurase/selenocysteine lyase
MAQTMTFDVTEVRSHFDFPTTDRLVTNNAATTQPPRELIQLFARLAPTYECARADRVGRVRAYR